MIDIKLVRKNVEEVLKRLEVRGKDYSFLKNVISLDEEKRNLIKQGDDLKQIRNQKSKEIGILKSQKLDASEILNSVAHMGDEIKEIDNKIKEIDLKIIDIMESIPNLPFKDVPRGTSDLDNVEIRRWGEPRKVDFEVKPHFEVGKDLDILDFDRAAKIAGSRFVVYKGMGARLERALINFMMDLHANEHGYTEIIPPYIVNKDSLYGTGQLPKFEEDLYKLRGEEEWYLNPTAEVPTINMYRDEIIDLGSLPIKHVAYTTAFRSEAGSAGRDTRGILRQHQFNKSELIKITKPEDSYTELHSMLEDAEDVLKLLKLPYRVVNLCGGDLGFNATQTFDIEVWIPSENIYREISSVSNDEDFQARRANIRFKRDKDSKTEYVHTINGSGLAVGRTHLAILENYQNEDGSITIPEVLIPYMGGVTKIEKSSK